MSSSPSFAASIAFDTSSSGTGSGSASSGASVVVSFWDRITIRAKAFLAHVIDWIESSHATLLDVTGKLITMVLGYFVVMFQFKRDTRGRSFQHDDHLELFYLRKLLCNEYKVCIKTGSVNNSSGHCIHFHPYHRLYIGQLPAPMYLPYLLYCGYLVAMIIRIPLFTFFWFSFSLFFSSIYIIKVLGISYSKRPLLQVSLRLTTIAYRLSLYYPDNELYARIVSRIIILVSENEWVKHEDIDKLFSAVSQKTNSTEQFAKNGSMFDLDINKPLSQLIPTLIFYESLFTAYCIAFARSNHPRTDCNTVHKHLTQLDSFGSNAMPLISLYSRTLIWLMACQHIQKIDASSFHVSPENLKRQERSLCYWMIDYCKKNEELLGVSFETINNTMCSLHDKYCNSNNDVAFVEVDSEDSKIGAEWKAFFNLVSQMMDECIEYNYNYERLI
ncbi:MAG: hypothetical protein II897_10895 [Clostridia bacterium]|nr:hypothetical protein [Clostridia bacterium]